MENNRKTKTKQYQEQAQNFLICFSVCLVLLFNVILAIPANAQAASLYFSPSSSSYVLGKTMVVSVYVSSSDQAINAASGIISFQEDKMQVVSLSKTGSIISLWVQEPSFSNTSGTVNFEGIVLNPGFIGSNGKIIDIIFKSKVSGITPLRFFSSAVLANDGKGTNILTSSGNASYNIVTTTTTKKEPIVSGAAPAAPVISSETHPDSDKWYSSTIAKFSWTLTDDIIDVRLRISEDPKALPTIIYSPAISSKTVVNLGEGVWYFSAQFKNKYGWGEVAYFRLQIDSTSSEPLEPLESLVITERPEGLLMSRGIIILISICLIILVMVIWLYYCRTKLLQKKLKEEAKKTEQILYQAFDNLRKEVTKQVAKLDGNDILSEREAEINEKFKKAIRNSEQIINEKLKHIEEKIDED